MKRIVGSVFLLFGLMNVAYSDVLFTAPLPSLFANNNVHCGIVNISGRARVVTVEILNSLGERMGGIDQLILRSKEVFVAEAFGNVSPVYCKFTVEGASKHYRASIAQLRQDVGYTAALPAFPLEPND